jgi:hypothetical protein
MDPVDQMAIIARRLDQFNKLDAFRLTHAGPPVRALLFSV